MTRRRRTAAVRSRGEDQPDPQARRAEKPSRCELAQGIERAMGFDGESMVNIRSWVARMITKMSGGRRRGWAAAFRSNRNRSTCALLRPRGMLDLLRSPEQHFLWPSTGGLSASAGRRFSSSGRLSSSSGRLSGSAGRLSGSTRRRSSSSGKLSSSRGRLSGSTGRLFGSIGRRFPGSLLSPALFSAVICSSRFRARARPS